MDLQREMHGCDFYSCLKTTKCLMFEPGKYRGTVNKNNEFGFVRVGQ